MNPTNADKIMELGFALGLSPRDDAPEASRLGNLNIGLFPEAKVKPARSGSGEPATVLDIACGKGAVSYLLAENFHARCIGVDISEGEITQANSRRSISPQGSMVSFHEAVGGQFVEDLVSKKQRFDACLCIGATFVFGDFAKTIDALAPCCAESGAMAIGEETLNMAPGVEEFAEEYRRDNPAIKTDFEYVEIARKKGFELVYLIDSGLTDWDRYTALQWLALYQNLYANRDSDTARDYWDRRRAEQEAYLKKERQYLGWKIFVLRPSL